jgi:hypothetical protein
MRRFAPLFVTSAILLPPVAHAGLDFDFDIQPTATEHDFKSVAKDVAGILNSKSLTPAEPYGVTGFGIGAYGTYLETKSPGAWQRVTGEDIDQIGVAGLIAQKGLPFGIDVGGSYSWVPGGDAKMFGAEVRYALVEGGVAIPAVGLRGSYSHLSGVDDLKYDSYGIDLSVSKGLGPLTPYAGVGHVWSKFKVEEDTALLLDNTEKFDSSRLFVGVRLSALFGITPEYERIGKRDAFNLRIGFAF